MKIPYVTDVVPLANYFIEILYETGERKKFDVKPYISGDWFGQLKDLSVFNTVRPSGRTIEWCGGQDIAPHELWDNSISV